MYQEAFVKHIKIPGHDLLVPIIFFIDKTHVDAHGHLTLEPITFTLGIFKKETCRLPIAWHCLGYMVNQANVRVKMKSITKAEDYHYILSIILKGVANAQKTDGVAWNLPFNGKIYPTVFKLLALIVISDTEGHNKLCLHFLTSLVCIFV